MSVPRHMLPTPPPMQQAEAKGPQKYIVYVENPPTKGPDGKLVESIAVGTKVNIAEMHKTPSSATNASSSSSASRPAGATNSTTQERPPVAVS
jgi:hypothetical protein